MAINPGADSTVLAASLLEHWFADRSYFTSDPPVHNPSGWRLERLKKWRGYRAVNRELAEWLDGTVDHPTLDSTPLWELSGHTMPWLVSEATWHAAWVLCKKLQAKVGTSHEAASRLVAERFINAEDRAPDNGDGTDDGSWVLISKLQPAQIANMKERRRYIEKHKDEIRTRRPTVKTTGKPHPKRLEVHIGDWVKHWAKVNDRTFDSLDKGDHTPITADKLADDLIDGATKLYSDIFQGKKPKR